MKMKGQKGLSLVEVTIMLLVLMLLTSVLAPSFWDFIHDAQWVKVKEDCEAIGISFTRLTRDIGPCLRVDSGFPCDLDHRVDILVSEGASASDQPAGIGPNARIRSLNWLSPGSANNQDDMHHQFIDNSPGYMTPYGKFNLGHHGEANAPLFGLGWRGAYLSPPIGPDPWGIRYYVNSGFFSPAHDASATGDGGDGWWWEHDVICISAGPNQVIDVGFDAGHEGKYGTKPKKDDFIHVISGSGR